MSPESADLTTMFLRVLRGRFGIRRGLSTVIRAGMPIIIEARTDGLRWDEIAGALSSALKEVGRPLVSPATLRGVVGREQRVIKTRQAGGIEGIAVQSPTAATIGEKHRQNSKIYCECDLAEDRQATKSSVLNDGNRIHAALKALRSSR